MEFKASFFAKPSEKEKPVRAARTIQKWWKQARLRQISEKISRYVHHILSLEQAEEYSFESLSALLENPEIQKKTYALLNSLEQAKDLLLPADRCQFIGDNPERIFLSAYLIATKSDHLFGPSNQLNEKILTQSEIMIKSFEILSQWMCENYLDHPQDGVQNDRQLMTNTQFHLENFHQAQMEFYETFPNWERDHHHAIAETLIDYYLKLESKRMTISINPDPRQLELDEGYRHQQETLIAKIQMLQGEEGLRILQSALDSLQTEFEAKKWLVAPTEVLIHEIALDPTFILPAEACARHPQHDIDAAIASFSKDPIDLEPMLDVFEEIREHIAALTPHRVRRIEELRQSLSRQSIHERIGREGLGPALCQLIYFFIEQLSELESPIHEAETIAFKNKLDERLNASEDARLLLKTSIAFIYEKLSEITLESTNFHLDQLRNLGVNQLAEYEQKHFQARLSDNQFNLGTVLAWIDNISNAPAKYRLDASNLASQYLSTYMTQAMLIGLLEKPWAFEDKTIPETFYLDRNRLIHWHKKYQQIFYTVVAMQFLETFCQKHATKLSAEAVQAEQEQMARLLEAEAFCDPTEFTAYVMAKLDMQLVGANQRLSQAQQDTLKKLLTDICTGNHLVATKTSKLLCDHLSYYCFKGQLSNAAMSEAKLYGQQSAISALGQAMIPLLRLHVKVHGSFYESCTHKRVWKPLFELLKNTESPTELPELLQPEADSIQATHAIIHKLAFLLSGLSLIQQTVVYHDMWNLAAGLKHATFKELADAFGITEMVHHPDASKEMIEQKLTELMKHVAHEQNLPFDDAEEKKWIRMLRKAKNGHSPGCHAFLNEFASLYQPVVTQGKMPPLNSEHLLYEFPDEIDEICSGVKKIVTNLKEAQRSEDFDPVAQSIPVLRSGY